MIKCLKISACLLGAIIGAGFASGREIVTFFSVKGLNFLSASLCGLITFIFCFVLLNVGRILKSKTLIEANKKISPILSPLFSVLIILNSFIVLSAMTAGVTAIGREILDYGYILTAVVFVIVSVVAYKGRAGVFKGGFYLVLLMVFLVVFIGTKGGAFLGKTDCITVKPISIIVYVAMNMLLAAGVSVTDNRLNGRECLVVSLVTGALIGVLSYILASAIRSNGLYDSEMPILDLAFRMGNVEYYASVLLMLVSIVTTMLICLCDIVDFIDEIFGCRILSIFIALSVSLVVSLIGFSDVIGLFYPIIGIIGILYFLVCVYKLFSSTVYNPFNNRDRKVHKCSKKAKDNG